ncbi:MAG: alanine--glyoxylate aminotransferase family protein [Chloroflexi bacterium]|nr:alanine--glyoxylate aminotransferase family protein [Chloroflexota bacterium]
MINHRGPEFGELIREVTGGLKEFFQTENDVLILTASGTGALEAAVVNVLSQGDRVLAVTMGEFGDRFAEIARVFGADVVPLKVSPGQAADPGIVRQFLTSQGPFKAVLLTHNETSTGVTNDVEAIARVVHEIDALLLVDGISSVSSIEMKADAWGCDIVLAGSQKGWMCPPGLAFVSVGPRAWEAYETATMPRFYLDLGKARKYLERNQTPATPAVSILFALQEALRLMKAEGATAIFERHRRCAERIREGVKALGLELFADEAHASNTVTAVKVPADVDVSQLLKLLRADGVVLSGGQGSLAGKIFRIGHLGMIHESDTDEILSALERALPRAKRA